MIKIITVTQILKQMWFVQNLHLLAGYIILCKNNRCEATDLFGQAFEVLLIKVCDFKMVKCFTNAIRAGLIVKNRCFVLLKSEAWGQCWGISTPHTPHVFFPLKNTKITKIDKHTNN